MFGYYQPASSHFEIIFKLAVVTMSEQQNKFERS